MDQHQQDDDRPADRPVLAADRAQPADQAESFRRRSEEFEAKGLAEPFKGLTANGEVAPGLFPIRSTGISTEPVTTACGPTWAPSPTALPPFTTASLDTVAAGSTRTPAGSPSTSGLGASPSTRSREAATSASGVPTSRQ